MPYVAIRELPAGTKFRFHHKNQGALVCMVHSVIAAPVETVQCKTPAGWQMIDGDMKVFVPRQPAYIRSVDKVVREALRQLSLLHDIYEERHGRHLKNPDVESVERELRRVFKIKD